MPTGSAEPPYFGPPHPAFGRFCRTPRPARGKEPGLLTTRRVRDAPARTAEYLLHSASIMCQRAQEITGMTPEAPWMGGDCSAAAACFAIGRGDHACAYARSSRAPEFGRSRSTPCCPCGRTVPVGHIWLGFDQLLTDFDHHSADPDQTWAVLSLAPPPMGSPPSFGPRQPVGARPPLVAVHGIAAAYGIGVAHAIGAARGDRRSPWGIAATHRPGAAHGIGAPHWSAAADEVSPISTHSIGSFLCWGSAAPDSPSPPRPGLAARSRHFGKISAPGSLCGCWTIYESRPAR